MTQTNWAGFSTLQEAQSQICTLPNDSWNVDVNSMVKYNFGIKWIDTVLDFGCGVGRLIKTIWAEHPTATIYGYDNDNMIRLAREYLGEELHSRVNWLHMPIDNIKGRQYDLILTSLVLQHLDHETLKTVINTFHEVLLQHGKLFIISRASNDYGGRVWDFVLSKFNPITPLNLEISDPMMDHQKVLFEVKKCG